MELSERVQYKAAHIFSGCWQGTSRVKLCEKLGWESLSDRRWTRRLTIFYKIYNGLAPTYLLDHIPQRNEIEMSLRNRNVNPPKIRTERYENSFFPYTIKYWKNLDDKAKSKPSIQTFKKNILMTLFDLQGTHFTEFATKLESNYSLKSELVFQTYAITGSIIISTVIAQPARVLLKTKPQFTFSYAVRSTLLNVLLFLAKYRR